MKSIDNLRALASEIAGLKKLLEARLLYFFHSEKAPSLNLDMVDRNEEPSYFAQFCKVHQCSPEERWTLLIAIAPHLFPNFFDEVIQGVMKKEGDFTQIGGTRGRNHRGFLPTAETVLFILGGEQLERRIQLQQMFRQSHFFFQKRILWIKEVPEGEPLLSGRIVLAQEYVDLFTTGTMKAPQFGAHFPAQQLTTLMDWEDLILNARTLKQIGELGIWLEHGEDLLDKWGMRKKLKPGYRALFYGPPGTGKTLTAALLGKSYKRPVFKIDLSLIVSKFIGETEKNLAKLFDKAANKDWILFFDEADAIFGKRTNVKDAHDKYANQEIAYILQRIEDYNGLVILASNLKSNIDDAFMRRFQSHIHFPMPSSLERQQLWQAAFPEKIQLSPEISIEEIAQKFKLSGASIMNIVQYCALQALSKHKNSIEHQELLAGIRREYEKEQRYS